MVTGYVNSIVSEARYRISTIYAGIGEYDKILNSIQDATNYHMSTIDIYKAAREKIMALEVDIDNLKDFVNKNKDTLTTYDNIEYYNLEIETLKDYLSSRSDLLVTPGITTKEAAQESFSGIVTDVEDGDTFLIGERVIRMAGIDAAEGGTDQGKWAKRKLSDKILGKEVTVLIDKHTPTEIYGRILGTVILGDENISLWMVSNGYAEVLTKFGKNKYVDPTQLRLAHEKVTFGWPRFGEYKFVTSPTHAMILIDGKYAGKITPCELKIPVDFHDITFVAADCSSITERIDVEGKPFVYPPITLPKLPANVGVVIVDTDPFDKDAVAYQGDSIYGKLPLVVNIPTDSPVSITVKLSSGKEIQKILTSYVGVVTRTVVKEE
jgi:endonuclease YncB( thermonuclease family)